MNAASPRSLRRAVFLDRDGTLNVDSGYVSRPSDVALIEHAAEGAKALADAGFALVIASNQSGIARGLMTEAQSDAVDERLRALLRAQGVEIEAVYCCPHLPGGSVAAYSSECDCRKPKPGLLLRAARELGLDLPASWIVGDSARDVAAGLAAGCRAIALSPDVRPADRGPGVYRAKDLLDAAGIILSQVL